MMATGAGNHTRIVPSSEPDAYASYEGENLSVCTGP